MRRFPLNLQSLHSYFSEKSLIYPALLRILLGLSYIHILTEHFLDSEFIRVTSLAKFFKFGFSSEITKYFSVLLTSELFYHSFIAAGILLSVLFIWNRFAVLVPVLLFLYQQLFWVLNSGNMYGHELFFQQFFLLFMVVTIAEALIQNSKSDQLKPALALARGLAISLFQLQLLVVYFVSGLGKWLSPDWNQPGILQRIFLNAAYRPAFFDFVFKEPYSGFISPNAVPLFLMLLPFLILLRKTRKPAFLLVFLFHLLIAIKLEIYGFSFFMIISYLIFFTDKKTTQDN